MPWRRERLPTPVFWPGQFCGVAKSQTRVSDFHFTLLSVIISSSIHVVANGMISSFFFLNGWVIFHLIYIYIYIYACMLSCFSLVPLFVTLWTVTHQAPLSMGFSRKEYWSGLPCPPETHTHTYTCACAHTHVYHICFIQSSVDEHLGCLHVLIIINSAALNIEGCVSFWIRIFCPLGIYA